MAQREGLKINVDISEVELIKFKINELIESIEKLNNTKAHVVLSVERTEKEKPVYKKLFWKIHYKTEET
jgi:hypothetical protein